MKKITVLIIILTASVAFADETDQEILSQLKELREKVMEQQAEINSLKAALSETKVSEAVRSELDKQIDSHDMAQVKQIGPVLGSRPNVIGLDIKGELKMGYLRIRDNSPGIWDTEQTLRDWLKTETNGKLSAQDEHWIKEHWEDYKEGALEKEFAYRRKSRNYSAFYTQLRLGGLWQTIRGWKVGAGLVTGWDSQDPRDRRDIWSEHSPFESGSIALDYAYVQHNWDQMFSLTIGQQFNPFKSSHVLWDKDIRPVGVTAQYDFEGAFATAGWYDMLNMGTRNVHNNRDVQMWAGQIGYSRDIENVDFTVATAYYNTSSNVEALRNPWRTKSNCDYNINTADLFAEVGSTVGDLRLKAQGQVWHNFSARGDTLSQTWNPTLNPNDNDTGWMLGLSGEIANLRVGYAFSRVEADSFPAPLTNEFSPVNSQGHKFEIGCRLSEYMDINGIYHCLEQVRGNSKADIYQLYLNYLF